jgi:atypical dual specificity phosphatase
MPANFSFVIDGVLAGMERPGTFSRLREDLEFLKDHNIAAIVSLTECPLERVYLEEFGFRYLHLPIPDFTPPSIEQIDMFIEFAKSVEAQRAGTVVHCGAGMGRTGTMLACAFVARGFSPDTAIDKVRETRPHSIETLDQEQCIIDYADLLSQRRENK